MCKKTCGSICQNLRQSSLSSMSQLIRHWCLRQSGSCGLDTGFSCWPSVDTTDWMHGRKGHRHAWVRWHIAKDVLLPLKYSNLVNTVTACPMCSKDCPRHLPKEYRATCQQSQMVREWQVDHIGPLPPSEGSKCALVYGDPTLGWTQAFPYCI